MNIDKTIEENINESYFKGENKGLIKGLSVGLFLLLIPCAYILIQNSNAEYEKQVNHFLYNKLADDCQVKINSMMEAGSFVLPKK